MKILKAKVNQKCCDSRVVKVKKEALNEDKSIKEELKDEEELKDVEFEPSEVEGSSSAGTTRPAHIPLYKPFVDASSEESDDDD